MSIFGDIAKTFSPKSKAPTLDALERLERDAAAAVEAARKAYEALEAGRVAAILGGDAARTEHRAKLTTARDDVTDSEAAHAAVRDRLDAARVEAAERGRREAYDRAAAVQRAASDAILHEYTPARDTLLRLQRLAAEADELVAIANRDLPVGAEPLSRETEGPIRDRPGQNREIVSSTIVELWVGEGGGPVADQRAVVSRDGRSGHITIQTGYGSHAVPVHRQTFEKRRVRPWAPPIFGERLGDLHIPPLRPDAPPASAEMEELEPITPPALAAE